VATINRFGIRSLLFNVEEQKRKHILIRSTIRRRNQVVLLPTTMLLKSNGPKRRIKSRLSLKRSISLIHASTKAIRYQGRVTTISGHISVPSRKMMVKKFNLINRLSQNNSSQPKSQHTAPVPLTIIPLLDTPL